MKLHSLKFIMKLTSLYSKYKIIREEWVDSRGPTHTDVIKEFNFYNDGKKEFDLILSNISVELFQMTCVSSGKSPNGISLHQQVEYRENNLLDLHQYYGSK